MCNAARARRYVVLAGTFISVRSTAADTLIPDHCFTGVTPAVRQAAAEAVISMGGERSHHANFTTGRRRRRLLTGSASAWNAH